MCCIASGASLAQGLNCEGSVARETTDHAIKACLDGAREIGDKKVPLEKYTPVNCKIASSGGKFKINMVATYSAGAVSRDLECFYDIEGKSLLSVMVQ